MKLMKNWEKKSGVYPKIYLIGRVFDGFRFVCLLNIQAKFFDHSSKSMV